MRPDRLARLHAAVDRQAGERILVIPYTAGGMLAGAPDPTRPPLPVLAQVNEVPKVLRGKGAGVNTGRNAELRLGSHTIKFTTSALPWPITDNFHVVLLDRGGLELKVVGTEPIGTDRTVARLVPLPPVKKGAS